MKWPIPGESPSIRLTDIPVGTRLLGMAPIGVRWYGVMTRNGPTPDKGCPPSEFAVCGAMVGGVMYEVKDT
jgi:hypothetical protein